LDVVEPLIAMITVFTFLWIFVVVVLLDWYIFIFGGVSCVYMCGFVVDWVRLFFLVSVLACVYMSSLSLFVGFVLFCVSCVCDFVFVCFFGGCDSLAPNEDIVRFMCGGGKSYILCIFLWKFFSLLYSFPF